MGLDPERMLHTAAGIVYLMAAAAGPPPLAEALAEIDRTAASEPPVLGIDTQIRAARLLSVSETEECARLLRASSSRIFALPHQATQAALLRDWLKIQIPLNRADAELTLRAWVESLPDRGLTHEDRAPFLNLAESVKEEFPDLAKTLRERAGTIPETDPQAKPQGSQSSLFGLSRLTGAALTLDETVMLARREKDPAAALDLLMNVMDDEADPRRRGVLLSEALDLTARVVDLSDRLLAQSMLARRLYQAGDRPRAAAAAQMLADTFESLYHCEPAFCDRFTNGENPGEAIHLFAEYLREHHIMPEDLGLTHPSLRVRLLLLDLEAQRLKITGRDGDGR